MPQISVSDETYAKIKDQLTEEPSPVESLRYAANAASEAMLRRGMK